ncbi:hypothetical protein CBM2633_A10383 [Cupriavidus taiwanensis]|uniref:Uncharacterized protein n=1 Tax=Cupriavidus taiwanensis TaxID=164546 RepID=A0A375DXH9_9BURK|nr:hypothetical protein CBM2604_A30045 [Cupriavidus taiwanensis]SOZ26554.1 hypothetical protein CBM2609_A30045 [Cupriavidus taiwanensis]SOZ45343.1 hypothetical protein CBM2610_A30047 [Cupriavidus taiwanensis]SOZ51453.1 hypothetical protein CBM2615_A20100 [Cupriavidus taiwanensis]SOZ53355.1 hypothetical protein CBM2614_A20099 [Cupriavidus taiwanensis]
MEVSAEGVVMGAFEVDASAGAGRKVTAIKFTNRSVG